MKHHGANPIPSQNEKISKTRTELEPSTNLGGGEEDESDIEILEVRAHPSVVPNPRPKTEPGELFPDGTDDEVY